MFNVIFSLDYEIHGNGEGCPYELMVKPTDHLLSLFDQYGAKLTIMADIAEILKFKEFTDREGRDDFHYKQIIAQLQRAVRSGHDVQLHIHASYFNATLVRRRWAQDWSEYNFAGLSLKRLKEVIELGKGFLESILRPVSSAYRCEVFRAANWSVSPSQNIVSALLSNGIKIDTSVFKYGQRNGLVSFDYSSAESETGPWRADRNEIWRSDPNGEIWEVPIYSERRRLGAFLSLNRIHRLLLGRLHRFPAHAEDSHAKRIPALPPRPSVLTRLGRLVSKQAWKADFNQCTGRQLIHALNRADERSRGLSRDLPFVLIGHSKLFTRMNERTLRPFLAYVAGEPSRARFARYDTLELAA